MDAPLTLLFFKHTPHPLVPMFKDSYNCGWLSNGLDEPYVLQWGNTKNKDTAKLLMQDVFEKQGHRRVLFYEKELPLRKRKSSIIVLTQEIYQDILSQSEKWS